jgi:GcrA cell cycle regulator
MASMWSENIVEALKALAADGLSSSQAAAHFNGMTRNAAIGIAFRTGFRFLRHGGAAYNTVPAAKKRRNVSAPRPPQDEIFSTTPLSPPRDGQLTLDELHYDSCRFIEGEVRDPNHRYCGQQTIPDKSWCPHHATIVYQPREQR